MAGWEGLAELLRLEVVQRREEGCKVDGFIERVEEAKEDEGRLMEVYEQLRQLEVDESFPFSEPSELQEIRSQRPAGPRKLPLELSEKELLDKFHGAWLGRSVGCALGKPLEVPCFMKGSEGRPGWKNVQLWFEGAEAWPIRDYTPSSSRASEAFNLKFPHLSAKSERGNIRFMESDDDIRYTVLGMILLEEKGTDWSTWDIGKLWHSHLAYSQVCTAETQAFLNFAQVTSHMETSVPDDWEQKKHWVRAYLNPYREWIGAQIRADGLAYGSAGNPQLAAELAWRDASFSHVKNGIYGEMFTAAMIAAAFVETDPRKLVEIGLSEIPTQSRLAHDIRKAVEIAGLAKDQLELVEKVWDAFKHYHEVHTNNNAALVVASLVFAEGDFEKAITTAVLGGWDTDCNGATVGSIMGAMLGAGQLPESWTSKLNDTLYAEFSGFHPIAISECARRSYEVFRKINPV